MCEHMLADMEGICIDCGAVVPEETLRISPEEIEFVRKQRSNNMEVYAVRRPMRANIPEIVKLADASITEFSDQMDMLRDPASPDQPRMKLVGGSMFRPSWEDIFNNVVYRSYMGAVMQGYRQGPKQWKKFLEDTIMFNAMKTAEDFEVPAPPEEQ